MSRWPKPAVSWRRPSRRLAKFSKRPTVRSYKFLMAAFVPNKTPRARVLPARGNLSQETARRPQAIFCAENLQRSVRPAPITYVQSRQNLAANTRKRPKRSKSSELLPRRQAPQKLMAPLKRRRRTRQKRKRSKTPTGTSSNALFPPTCSTITTADRLCEVSTQVSDRQEFFANLFYGYIDLALPDLSKLIGDEWKRLSETQKAVRFLHFKIDNRLQFVLQIWSANLISFPFFAFLINYKFLVDNFSSINEF